MQKMTWFVKFMAWFLALGRQYKTIKETYGDNEPCENGGCNSCVCVPTPPVHKGNG